ncbi:MAG: diguanylate cyclase [Betaproteobacteria bacterium]|nr:diguanylate cyclase [Betaproteobacteria bacterium]
MQLLDCIETQLIANRLPLVGVSVAAVPYANTPVVLTLHWHGFVETRLAEVTDANVVAYQPVPSSALQVNERWDGFADLENAVLEVAWELGSWDLARREAPPFIRPGSSAQESVECMGAFGNLPIAIEGQPPIVAEVPDGEELIEAAGRAGYVHWMFRPVRGGVWAEVAEDLTLEEGGYRNPPCPHLSAPTKPGRSRRVVYQFGRCDRLAT